MCQWRVRDDGARYKSSEQNYAHARERVHMSSLLSHVTHSHAQGACAHSLDVETTRGGSGVAKICEFEAPRRLGWVLDDIRGSAQENIMRLHVKMHDGTAVHVSQCGGHVSKQR